MPKYELDSERQRRDFEKWRSKKLENRENSRLGHLDSRSEEGFYYVDIIDGELVGHLLSSITTNPAFEAVRVSGEPEQELLEAGVIFETMHEEGSGQNELTPMDEHAIGIMKALSADHDTRLA